MARNEEKAQSMLNRFITMKQDEKRKPRERRPYLASECRDLADADRWRGEILREIGVKVAEIQNEGLGEHRLRDLNDEINKLLRERGHWERRILELGGRDYSRSSNAALMTDLDGNIVAIPNPSGRGPGYRYFGAAKKLPGVRELFDKPPEVRKRRTRYEIHKRINAGYYGYYDDEDGVLEPLEAAAEKRMRDEVVTEWHRVEKVRREAMKNVVSGEVAAAGGRGGETAREVLIEEVEEEVEEERRLEEEKMERERGEEAGREFIAHVPLPDEKEIERMVLEKKKKELLSKYTSDTLQGEQKEAKEMLNVQR
ncbi:pre-mRNA-splicing factor ISY1 homolog [Lolium rigidum]|uniref:pre-mRNA-splicing factor ISY1 homolog n=1 Tax=Lolium rigidum TaxID=89674 RepID=UPI001F5DC570|nr:pre-mRNA-splicing factor ISY1 homolog [Lolium rigidum]